MTHSSANTFRLARADDVPAIVDLLARDPLGATREQAERPIHVNYMKAFEAIDADPNNELVVAAHDDEILGVLQMTFVPSLTRLGTWRALIEGVRVAARARRDGLGSAMIRYAIERARERGCGLVQLTTDKSRAQAKRFYECLGFVASHEGMKLAL